VQGFDCGLGDLAGRQHDPNGSGFLKLLHKMVQICGWACALFGQLRNALRIGVKDCARMTLAHESANNVSTHAAQANHS
jgi:hypothetical protein